MFTTINVVGLAVSFMFILLIADMVTRQLTVDSDVPDADRIYIMAGKSVTFGHYQIGQRFQNRYPEIESWCSWGGCYPLIIRCENGEASVIKVAFVGKNFFDFFGYKIIKGNTDSAMLPDQSIVMTRTAALRLFGSDDVMGNSFNIDNLNGSDYVVTAIAEDIDNSIFPSGIDAFLPQDNIKWINEYSDINDTNIVNESAATLFFKFYANTDPEANKDDMLMCLRNWIWSYRSGNSNSLTFVPMRDFYFSEIGSTGGLNQYDFAKVVVFFVAGLIILIMAVLNYIVMNVAQMNYRAKEMATRRLLGSSQKYVFCRIMAESAMMVVMAFTAGLLLASVVEPYAIKCLGVRLDVIGDFTPISIGVWLLFMLLLSFVSGLIPASALSMHSPMDIVRGRFRGKTKIAYLRLLSVVQCGFAVALLSCAIYLTKQIHDISNVPLGYVYGDVIEYPPIDGNGNMKVFRSEAMKLPYVKNVAFSKGLPVDGGYNMTMPVTVGDSVVNFRFQTFEVDSAFIKMFNIKITEDRKLAKQEMAYYINESGLKDYAELGLGTEKISCNYTVYIAGQFKDFKIRSVFYDEQPLLLKILPTDSINVQNISVEITDDDIVRHKQELDSLYHSINGGIPFDSKWYGDMVSEWYDDIELLNYTIIAFAVSALLISLSGLVAMNIYMISQRKRDIAVRKVFGSTAETEMRLLLRLSMWSIITSLLIAIPLAVSGLIKIYDFVPFGDFSPWWTIVVAFAIVAVVSLLSVYLIGRKAVNENPVENIKTE